MSPEKEKSFDIHLYNLPLDLKVKIFQIAVQSNLAKWQGSHQVQFRGSLTRITTSPLPSDARPDLKMNPQVWYLWPMNLDLW